MKVKNVKEIGKAIKERRKSMGYTQKDISELTGLSTSFLSDVENGKETVEIGKALFLINILGMDILIKSRGE